MHIIKGNFRRTGKKQMGQVWQKEQWQCGRLRRKRRQTGEDTKSFPSDTTLL